MKCTTYANRIVQESLGAHICPPKTDDELFFIQSADMRREQTKHMIIDSLQDSEYQSCIQSFANDFLSRWVTKNLKSYLLHSNCIF
jgi:hypothetical protein